MNHKIANRLNIPFMLGRVKSPKIRIIVLNRKLRRFIGTLVRIWHKRTLLAYVASFGPNVDLFNYYWRPLLLRLSGVVIGESTAILSGIHVSSGELSIGDEVFINSDCRLACGGSIFIGSYCQIGARVSFETVSHQLAPVENGRRPSDPSPIIVEDNVWIGSGAILLPGVTIGEGSVVAAGAVVANDVEPYTVVGGVPAKTIRVLEPNESMAHLNRK